MNSSKRVDEWKDPYQLNPADVSSPPRSLFEILKRTGPGIILASSIVGSGELIATTTLGAQTGYLALWVILLSCVIKPAVQAEIGRYTVATGETGLAGFNRVPGPRWKVGWVVWAWVLMICMTQLQVGAMLGGVSQVMNQLVPSVPVTAWVLAFLVLTLALLLGGGYSRIQGFAMMKVGLFTLMTLLAAVVLTRKPQYFQWHDLLQGFQFRLPAEGVATAIAVFGITGVGSTELFMYPYWCVEKGYARFTGKREPNPEWRIRALGWIRVMQVDIIASMVIYTIATIAFYLLGAGILHGMGLVPAAQDMIPVLSNIYTQTLGEWSLWVFYLGAIVTLYGTIFASVAAHSRVCADVCRLMGLFEADDYQKRIHFRKLFVITLTLVPAGMFIIFQSPVRMVVAGGVVQSLMLPIICVGTLYLRHRELPKEVSPPTVITIAVWAATFVVSVLMCYYAFLSIR